MNKYHIALLDSERQFLSRIDFRASSRSHDENRSTYLANIEPVLALMKGLNNRIAIPPVRLAYWNDPFYNNGRMSRREVFESNGCSGEDVFTHPHFLPFLRYFLFGSELPDPVIKAFEEKVGSPEWVTSGDIVPIGKFARDISRSHQHQNAPEEFFKLCLDMGLGLTVARSVMQAVK